MNKLSAIKFNGVISSINTKKDGSMGLRIATPELTSTEKVEVMELQGICCDIFVKPPEDDIKEILTISNDMEGKTPSQRQRAVLFVWWKQLGEPGGDFEIFYRNKIEKNIDYIKGKLD